MELDGCNVFLFDVTFVSKEEHFVYNSTRNKTLAIIRLQMNAKTVSTDSLHCIMIVFVCFATHCIIHVFLLCQEGQTVALGF